MASKKNPSDVNRREFLKSAAAASLSLGAASAYAQQEEARKYRARDTGKSAADLIAPKLDRVRAAFIGCGARGPSHIEACLNIEGVDVVAICDNHEPSAQKGFQMVTKVGRPAPALYTKGDLDYRRMLERTDIDIVFISTPWEWHVPMAVDTMKAGKHAFVEVPAAYTVDGCWELVETSEKTQRHCMMLENVNYGREELMVLNMCQMGLFGELLHGEAAYIHDLRWQMNEIEHGTGSWRTLHYTRRNGNLYPTHGLGPVCHYMNVNRGDRLDFMSSVSSNARTREIYAKEKFPIGHDRRNLKFVCGDINTSIVRTVMGKTIMIQWDEQLPRPYTRHNFIQGTRGAWGGFPNRIAIEEEGKSAERWTQGAELKPWYDKYDHPLWKKLQAEAEAHGGHGGMDFIMVWRIIYCLRNGLPLDQSVYDAAAWSVIAPLSERSVKNRGQSIDIPDFTRGKWKSMKPLQISV
jgi:hypothetical protein